MKHHVSAHVLPVPRPRNASGLGPSTATFLLGLITIWNHPGLVNGQKPSPQAQGSGLQQRGSAGERQADVQNIFARKRLVAWCIVPFDGKKRGPAERAAMCARLGLKRIAYDWRDEHVATFEQEILEYRKHKLEYFAFWGVHDEAFRLFDKYNLHPQIWQMLAAPNAKTQEQRVAQAARQILPLVERTRKMGCKLGLYNHGGWAGEPANLVAVCRYLRKHHDAGHVGIVYNQHHAHNHIDDFAQVVAQLKPYLLCLNLNGMSRDGDQRGRKILPLGEGEFDVPLLKIIRDSGYQGPIGIIGHTQDDVEQRLQDNLDGLDWILPQLEGRPAGPKPKLRTWSPRQSAPAKPISGTVLPGRPEYRTAPLTVECRVTLPSRGNYNIIVASDTKQSGAHWELFSMNQTGTLTLYTPGLKPDHTPSQSMICDGKPHLIGMRFESNRVRLFVDGRQVADQAVTSTGASAVHGGLAIARLVEGGLGCSGPVDWVRISRGIRQSLWDKPQVPERDAATLLLWKRPESKQSAAAGSHPALSPAPYSKQLVTRLLAEAAAQGDPRRGLLAFSTAKSACLNCHRLGSHGGVVGPELTQIGKQRKPAEIVESILWPKRHVKPEFLAHLVVTTDGLSHRGYVTKQNARSLVIRDPTRPERAAITVDQQDIEFRRELGTLMPENLAAAVSHDQLLDLIQLLATAGRPDGVPLPQINSTLQHTHAHLHGPAQLPFDLRPIRPAEHPHWQQHVNRDRIYDFYAKQADHFLKLADAHTTPIPTLLTAYPGLDGGTLGHWGNQNEKTWASGRWNQTQLGSVQCGVFRGAGVTVPRGVCVRLGDEGQMSCCFNPDTLSYDAVWHKGFLKFSEFRHGFIHGVLLDGVPLKAPSAPRIEAPVTYHGFYRIGRRVVFAYRKGDTEYLDSPTIRNGQFTRIVAPRASHPLRNQLTAAAPQWPQRMRTKITLGSETPYTVDTMELPTDNPWKALFFAGGHDFLPDGSALVCTMQGDVWRVSGLQHPSQTATWNRFAAGLHHCQGIVVDSDGVFVIGRDQITRLHDQNDDGEADFYECFSRAFDTSPAGHDFICGLVRDAQGRFYTASGNQGVVRIRADGQQAQVVASGFRNPDGIGLTPDGLLTVPCSEGEWTPASMICALRPDEVQPGQAPPFFGYRGPRNGERPQLPLAYLPRGLDNSAGGQTSVTSRRWGPLNGQLLHFSFGTGAHFLVLRDEVDRQIQGAVVPLPGEFLSGAHRGRFNPADGQLYVSGMQGWGSYTPQTGCFQRVRYTGDDVQLPVGFHVHQNGILVRFSAPLDPQLAADARHHFAQCWNYRYSAAYGSPEFSTRHHGVRGHDTLHIRSAHVLSDGRSLFLEIPELQPANQVHLRLQSGADRKHELFVTVHGLDQEPFLQAPGLKPINKTIRPHPVVQDLAMVTRSVPNPYRKAIAGARPVTIQTAGNLSYTTRTVRVRAGEPIALTLDNPDVVPHNWALARPGTLERVGHLANLLISDPEAVVRHYIPRSSDILVYTNVVLPKEKTTVYFHAPQQPGSYPFLCTFPGHWLVMNGELIVESAEQQSAKPPSGK